MLKNSVLAIAAFVFSGAAAYAQDAAPVQSPAPAPWGTSCTSEGRDAPTQCKMEQRVVLSDSGALLASVTIQPVAGATAPMMVIRVPYGIHFPAGLRMAVDGSALETLPFQTCDAQGCFAGGPTNEALIDRLEAGNNLEITFQDQMQRNITVPVSLNGFTAAFERIQ